MKKTESKEIAFWMFMAVILFVVVMYASVMLAAEHVITIPDGDTEWEMTISPRNSRLTQPKAGTSAITPVAYTLHQDASSAVPPAPAKTTPVPKAKPKQAEASVTTEQPCLTPGCSNYDVTYRSIPFRRSEYLANPSYRHEATMEIMFGQLRPTVIQKLNLPRYSNSFPEPVPYGRSYRRAYNFRYQGRKLAPYYNRYSPYRTY